MILITFIFIITISLFLISSFLFFAFKIALVIATIKLVHECKEDIKDFISSLTNSFNKPHHDIKSKEKEVKEFTEIKKNFRRDYDKEKNRNFRRVK